MKHSLLTAALVMIAGSGFVAAQSQVPDPQIPILETGIGPAIAGSVDYTTIPRDARSFIHKHFRHLTIAECDREFSSGKLEVKFTDGTEVEFDAKGRWIEIDAPDHSVISSRILKGVLPHRAIRTLEHYRADKDVESIKREHNGYKIELQRMHPDEYRFASDGRLLSRRD